MFAVYGTTGMVAVQTVAECFRNFTPLVGGRWKGEECPAVRGMTINNVDFCYKKLSSHHRLIQTIPFCFGNRMGSENKIFILILSILLVHGLFILPW